MTLERSENEDFSCIIPYRAVGVVCLFFYLRSFTTFHSCNEEASLTFTRQVAKNRSANTPSFNQTFIIGSNEPIMKELTRKKGSFNLQRVAK